MKVTKRKNRASDEDMSDGEQVEKQRKKKARVANGAGVETPTSVNAAGSEGKPNDTLFYGRSIHLQPWKQRRNL